MMLWKEGSNSFRIIITFSPKTKLRNNLFYRSLPETVKVPNCYKILPYETVMFKVNWFTLCFDCMDVIVVHENAFAL